MDPMLTAPELTTVEHALGRFHALEGLRGQGHIKPLHQYVAMRLVVEGGFLPDEVTPHPPLIAKRSSGSWFLEIDEGAANVREETVLGGLKTKNVDVAVAKDRIGPVVCVSIKGTGNAFRNLTNRMEEAIGDCTNLHMTYPAMVYAFLHLIKCNRQNEPGVKPNDVSIDCAGCATDAVARYHDVLEGLTGRELVRNEISKYEAVALLMVEQIADAACTFPSFPPANSMARFSDFFPRVYGIYDRRFPYVAPSMHQTERVAWAETSPAFNGLMTATGRELASVFDYEPRLA
ncbi:MAG TPA: hypothetical protein DEP45_04355 [Armatimonadetes bacterium]|nr:hypothetical protein [Armatimonadota bacterium]